ncbi:MAG: DUF3291 domain-containing protein [Bacteroidota bacterium]
MSVQVTTLTIFCYPTLATKAWAFGMMQFAHQDLATVSGQQFYKLMGSGRGLGFNPWPDWSTYALLQVWTDEAAATAFFTDSPLIQRYRAKTSGMTTIFLRALRAHGRWSGQEPFAPFSTPDPDNPLVAVITRATIRTRHLRKFWAYVPTSQRPIADAAGLIYTKGIGEIPVKQMATFSVWENAERLTDFAYRSKEHRKAIYMTRDLDWYREELFVRFQPYRTLGQMEGLALPLPNAAYQSA